MKRLRAIDLFSGAGGLTNGLKQAGFEVLAASEINPAYSNTYRQNHPDHVVYTGDIRDLSVSEVRKQTNLKPGELDLLAGGPPCQGFSINAPIRTMDDKRNHLFVEFLRFVDELLPKYVLIENVPGIVSMGQGSVVASIHKALNDLGYGCRHMILYAAHYGVPQMRWRTIFIAHREGTKKPTFPIPTHHAVGRANFTGAKDLCFKLTSGPSFFDNDLLPFTTVGDAISDLPSLDSSGGEDKTSYTTPPQTNFQEYARKHSKSVWNHICSGLHPVNLERMKHVKPGGSWRDIPHELLPAGLKRARRSDHTRRYGRLSKNGLATTILTKCDPHWGTFIHYNQDRIISVREAARLQSFPDTFKFTGPLVQQYQQVGNAVPPLLGKVLGSAIIESLQSTYKEVKKGRKTLQASTG